MGRPQVVRVGNNISTPLILNTGAPQGCVLSRLLYSLFTHDCVALHASTSISKFTDNPTVVGLITNNDETAYREEVRALGVWCQENNLSLNGNITNVSLSLSLYLCVSLSLCLSLSLSLSLRG